MFWGTILLQYKHIKYITLCIQNISTYFSVKDLETFIQKQNLK